MNSMKILVFLALAPTIVMVQGCYASSSSDHNDDAADAADAPQDAAADDARTDDATPDPAPDPSPDPAVDVPDAVPAAPYTLHEWGVISTGLWGTRVHGPSPEAELDMAEKPVIYLYSDEEISPLSVKVDFTTGSAAEVWPDIPVGPHIEWNNLTIRPGACEATPFPYPWEDPLCEICNLGSCVVEDAGCITFGHGDDDMVTLSRLLFYAGPIEGYSPPLQAEVLFPLTDDEPAVEYSIRNKSTYDIEDVWLIYREAFGNCIDLWSACPVAAANIAFRFWDNIEPDEEQAGELFTQYIEAPVGPDGYPDGDLPLPDAWVELSKDLLDRLTERGLTDMEAGAFLRNWDQVFFGLLGNDSVYIEPLYANGAFLIYFMDRGEYDSMFRLTTDPPPRESVRVGMIYDKLPMYNE